MKLLPLNSSDDDLIRYVDEWAAYLENEDYRAAHDFVDHETARNWSPELVRDVIKRYGDSRPSQRVTVIGRPTDISQRKQVSRWPKNRNGAVGEIWYDLNIDGLASDLTATFGIFESKDGLLLRLDDIHVM